jgi:monofunctional biosynthetic peptidoglycan transglycosylase
MEQFEKSSMRFAKFKILLTSCLLLFGLAACFGSPQGCAPKLKDLKTQYPRVIYRGPKEPFEVEVVKKQPPNWVSLSQVSRSAQMAILISEDWAFYSHPGYDGKQIREAIEESIESGKLKRGASTITQQVVKNVFLSQEKSLIRKVRELWLATKVEKILGKKRILEIYLNIAEWGEGIFGISQASHHYFQKPASELTAKEGAFLAMLLPSPKKYSISYRKKSLTPYARKTIRSILNKLVSANVLTAEQKQEEWQRPFSFEINQAPVVTEPTSTEDDTVNDEEDDLPSD